MKTNKKSKKIPLYFLFTILPILFLNLSCFSSEDFYDVEDCFSSYQKTLQKGFTAPLECIRNGCDEEEYSYGNYGYGNEYESEDDDSCDECKYCIKECIGHHLACYLGPCTLTYSTFKFIVLRIINCFSKSKKYIDLELSIYDQV